MPTRCDWCTGDPLMEAYHDDEWGVRTDDDTALFELLTLEVFQAGLSWRSVLVRRRAFRDAFVGFNVERVSQFDDADVARLMQDAGIIRNRKKIESTIENARIVRNLQLEHGSFARWLDSLPNGDLANYQQVFRSTFRFCGPEITRMFVMGCGRVPAPHDPHCETGAVDSPP